MNIIRINTDDTMTEIKSNKNWMNTIRKNSNNDINLLLEWFIDDNSKLLLYGNLDGEHINNHVIPSNGISSLDILSCADITLYDNIYIVKLKNNKLINYSIKEYGEFYSINCDFYSDNINENDSDDEYNNNISYDNIYFNTNVDNNLSFDNNIY